jgi:hypothetical protein
LDLIIFAGMNTAMQLNSRKLIQEYLNIMTVILGKSRKKLKGKRMTNARQ